MGEQRRERTLNVRITEVEAAMLRALAAHAGLSQSDMVRQYIRRAFAELPQASKPPRK
ncbi:MAG: ribbon-helix-helix protein, CopG family [Myxococcales bacterium]|jgi:uncharacterized protein (DUF1778 family)|nr:ribbon-helix-helix protein, CopG family [Myxococcales bacterium]